MNIFLTLVIFYVGAALGSFLSVIVHRTHHNMPGILVGRSLCPNCKHQLNTLDLFPILSYVFFAGKCRYCHAKIAPHYLFLEIVTGIVLAALYLKFPFAIFTLTAPYTIFDTALLWEFLRYALISLTLLAIFFYDLLYQEIPDAFSLTGIMLALLGNITLTSPGFTEVAIGAGVGGAFFLIQLLISRGSWVGMGDVILGILMGTVLGWKLLIVALFISYISGTIISLWLLAANKATRKTKIPFAPFLVTGTILAILFGQQLLDWYLNSILV